MTISNTSITIDTNILNFSFNEYLHSPRSNPNPHKFQITDTDLKHAFITCDPLGLSSGRNKGTIGLYDNMLNNMITLKNNQINLRSNLDIVESSFKGSISFFLGMLLTCVIASKEHNIVIFNIRHLLKLNASIVYYSSTNNKSSVHPDFFALNPQNEVFVFDAKGSITETNGYINNTRIRHGKEQIDNVNSITLKNGSIYSNDIKKFVCSVARKKDSNSEYLQLSKIENSNGTTSKNRVTAQLTPSHHPSSTNFPKNTKYNDSDKYISIEFDSEDAINDKYSLFKIGPTIQIAGTEYTINSSKALETDFDILVPKDMFNFLWNKKQDKINNISIQEIKKDLDNEIFDFRGNDISVESDGTILISRKNKSWTYPEKAKITITKDALNEVKTYLINNGHENYDILNFLDSKEILSEYEEYADSKTYRNLKSSIIMMVLENEENKKIFINQKLQNEYAVLDSTNNKVVDSNTENSIFENFLSEIKEYYHLNF